MVYFTYCIRKYSFLKQLKNNKITLAPCKGLEKWICWGGLIQHILSKNFSEFFNIFYKGISYTQ